MALSYSTTVRNNRLDEITAAIGSNGLARIYSGTPPVNVGASLSGNTQLAELALSATAAPTASAGQLSFNTITDDVSADATGTATFFRLVTSGGSAVVQGTVGTSGADINFNTVSFSSGGTVSLTSLVLTEGNA